MKKFFFLLFSLNYGLMADDTRFIEASGNASIEVKATIAEVKLGIELEGKSTSQIQSDLAARINRLYKSVQQEKIQNLQTSQYTITPQYSNQAPHEIVGYKGQGEISFKTAIENIATLLPKAFDAGATRLNGIQLTATDEAIQAARAQALNQAAENALQEAKVVLNALKLDYQEIIQVSIMGSRPVPIYRSNVMYAAAKEAGPNLEGNQEINAEISLKIAFRDHLD